MDHQLHRRKKREIINSKPKKAKEKPLELLKFQGYIVSTVRLGCLLGIPAFLNRELNSQLMFLLNKLKDFHFNLSEKPDHINVFDFIVLADIWNFYSFFAIRVVSLFCNDYILMCQSVRTNP